MADPSKRGGRQYTDEEVRAILERALRHDQSRGVSHEDLVAAAEEIGVSRAAIEAAAGELEGRQGEADARAAIVARRRKGFQSHLFSFIAVNAFLFAINLLTPGPWWFFWPLLAWGLGLAFHARAALSTEVSPRVLRREVERTAARDRKERKRRAKEEKEAARRMRKERIEQSAEELGQAVEEGVAVLMSKVAGGIRGVAGSEERPRGSRVAPEAEPRVRVGAPGSLDDEDDDALAEDEVEEAAARRGRGRR